MKIPWALRLDLIMVVLRGNIDQISYFSGVYRIEAPSAQVQRWRRRRDRRAIREAENAETMRRYNETEGNYG